MFVHLIGCKFHDEIAICNCGANTICRNCGEGRGQYPCECTPPIKSIWEEKYPELEIKVVDVPIERGV